MPEQSNDYRVVVFGAGGVGKTSLVLRFIHGTFRDTYIPTIDVLRDYWTAASMFASSVMTVSTKFGCRLRQPTLRLAGNTSGGVRKVRCKS